MATQTERINGVDIIPPVKKGDGVAPQPERSNLEFDMEAFKVHMSDDDLRALLEYSQSIPPIRYEGRMWKAKGANGKWYLRFFRRIPGNTTVLEYPSYEIIVP